MSQPEHPPRIEISDGASIPDPWDKRLINAWSISLVGAVSLLTYLCVRYPDVYGKILSLLPEGIIVTFKVTIYSFAATVPIGVLVGIGRLSRNRFINLIASTYVETIRGIPLLVQLFYIFFSLNQLLHVPDFLAAIIALSFCYGAYMGEVFRAGINAINKGQTEAARSLGFTRFQTMRYIILPQAWRTILPPIGNECIAMLKDTSLLSVVAITDVFRIAREYASVSYQYFETYTVIALVYLIITLILSKCVSVMEARLSHYDKR
ncbi:amino acid ABC transporter permease [Desulfovibrio cuneatus]|uniref:amino acid ABC transporter permease n=1 Tax=Desulfovibrio cuneatus TaxID=159728 RepID=UPI0003FE91D3|nr:amino acid ABC transporter permease [Desulfovibrio cuneatus]